MDTSALTAAYADYLSLAEAGGFGEPEPGEWTAAEQIAHVALADASIAAVALAVASGQRPVYDNRASLDHWNLHRLIDEVGGRRFRSAGRPRRAGPPDQPDGAFGGEPPQ
ncbi:hypothetical protein PACID_04080 [Acidipropionibacterium acidipropionici ATCC 4875]|uniref:DinB-like domain-containing protein n=1 Tax=Acidipropionibacterium acidipropionici (strain ATCC 4875 / DSM 20272 / JCM 6432 / NBRC 12425 / NCIMB 8070 / 4) TaxID=1171373 RepID=K7SG54_ACIA4|nr:hypothetical protein [Acidipropionibacterium acidipropionici]AFV88250.1 hypothetical protein PACID_04080 [Acidipropionibacterium acidipropionici ATCC 4875]